jgi:hypothetical protein
MAFSASRSIEIKDSPTTGRMQTMWNLDNGWKDNNCELNKLWIYRPPAP